MKRRCAGRVLTLRHSVRARCTHGCVDMDTGALDGRFYCRFGRIGRAALIEELAEVAETG